MSDDVKDPLFGIGAVTFGARSSLTESSFYDDAHDHVQDGCLGKDCLNDYHELDLQF